VKDHLEALGSLGADREHVLEFFFLFSRFEYALKRSSVFLKDQERAEADWDKYGNSLKGRFRAVNDATFLKALNYLESNPPSVQIVVNSYLNWKPTSRGDGESRERYILLTVQTVRNNLFHGGKYPHPTGPVPEVARNRQLIEVCIAVLNQCLALSPEVEGHFAEAA
jgi:hypothetical protein